jgi:hypothetical protein
MRRAVAVSTILVAVLTAGAFAGALQDQITTIDAFHDLTFIEGDGDRTGQSLRNLIVDNQQNVVGTAHESLFASFGQAIDATASGALAEANGCVCILGDQAQSIADGTEPSGQQENLALHGWQNVMLRDSPGVSNGGQTILLRADQGANTAVGVLDEALTVIGVQTSSIHSGTSALGAVFAGFDVVNTQTQSSQ